MPATEFFLVHAAGCGRCAAIAEEVQKLSGGVFAAVSQENPIVQTASLHEGARLPTGEPYILAIDPTGGSRILNRGAMVRLVVTKVGVRKALKIAGLLLDRPADRSRRGILVGGLASGVAALGWMTGLQSTASAESRTPPLLPDSETQARFAELAREPIVATALEALGRDGYDLTKANLVASAIRGQGILTIAFFESREKPEEDAGVLMVMQAKSGELEVRGGGVQRPAEDASSAFGTASASSMVQPMAWPQFWGCVVGLAGLKCGTAIAGCGRIPLWAVALACLTRYCGGPATEAAWACKGLL